MGLVPSEQNGVVGRNTTVLPPPLVPHPVPVVDGGGGLGWEGEAVLAGARYYWAPSVPVAATDAWTTASNPGPLLREASARYTPMYHELGHEAAQLGLVLAW